MSLSVGASPSGKAADSGSAIRRFESSRPISVMCRWALLSEVLLTGT